MGGGGGGTCCDGHWVMMMIKIGACQLVVQTKTTGYMVVSTACCYAIKQGLANLMPFDALSRRVITGQFVQVLDGSFVTSAQVQTRTSPRAL
jgi:hypothetical protein